MRILTILGFVVATACQGGGKVGDTGAAGGGSSDGGSSDGGSGDGGSGDTGAAGDGWCAVQQVIDAYACTACHSSGGSSPDLATDPYGALVDQASAYYAGRTLVIPGDPDNSFLLAKIAGTQAADEGTRMPPSGSVSDAEVQAVRDWIAAGASADCGDTGGGTAGTYHPEGWSDPAVHGLAAKMQDETCTDCHGADLTGGGDAVSCDSCHEDGWRTDCTFCHGGQDNQTGAPPLHISGEDDGDAATFIPHTAHVEDTSLHDAFDCTTCHLEPDDVLSDGHIFVGDATPGRAETDFSGGIASATTWDGAGTCSNDYCHGSGGSDDGTVTHTDSVSGCGDCHGDSSSTSRLGGQHARHASEGVTCEECHADTASGSSSIADPSHHVDGEVQVAFTEEWMSWNGSTCSGACHWELHWDRSW